jgi:hypothetical protein
VNVAGYLDFYFFYGSKVHMINAELTSGCADRDELEKILFKQRQFYSIVGL